jgi:hypothetical protein
MVLVFRDVFSGDEMFDGTNQREEVDEVAYCVRGEYSPVYTTHEDGSVTVRTAVDVVEKHGLRLVDIGRTQFLEYLSAYVQKLRVYLRSSKKVDRLEDFEANIQGFCRRIICNFGDFTFYAGRSNELDEGLAMCFYKEDQITPYFYFFIDSLRSEHRSTR